MKDIKKVAELEQDVYRVEPKKPNQKLKLTVGLPLSINHMYYNTRGGGKRLTKLAEQYVANTRAYINAAIIDSKYKCEDKCVWHYIDMIVYMPDRMVRDSHNMLKLLLDTMEGVAFNNDYYILPRILSVEYDKDNPRLELIMKPQTKVERAKALKEMAR